MEVNLNGYAGNENDSVASASPKRKLSEMLRMKKMMKEFKEISRH